MCGRFALVTSGGELLLHFGLSGARATPLAPSLVQGRYNIAPTQPVLSVRSPGGAGRGVDTGGGRELAVLRWGLIPSWAREASIGNRLVNARAETVAEKPAFRKAFQRRRCLVPMSAFYEWRRGGAKKAEPWAFRRADGGLFAVAGVWETWSQLDASEVETCALLTTSPNALVAAVHDRMPVIVSPADYERWLDPSSSGARLTDLLVPFSQSEMVSHRVSPRVGDVRNDDPGLLDPLVQGADDELELA